MRPRTRILALAAALVALTTLLVLAGRTPWPKTAEARAQRQLRTRLAVLRRYATRGDGAWLVPPGDAVLAIREEFLRQVLQRSLPLRWYFRNGTYVARIDSVDVRLSGGLALVTLVGRGMLTGREDSPFYSELLLKGLVAVAGIDPASGRLQADLVITDVVARRARPQDVQTLLNPAGGFFSSLKAQDWNRNRHEVHLPLRIEREIVLPRVEGVASLAESRIPLAFEISAVTTLDERMAISLTLRPEGARPPPVPPAPFPRHLIARRLWARRWRSVEVEQESLLVAVDRLARKDRLWRAAASSDHDVVAVVPAAILQAVVGRVSRNYLQGVSVDVRPEADIRFDQSLRVKLLGRNLNVGRFDGVINIEHVHGEVALAGDPRLEFRPPEALVLSAPVRLRSGAGRIWTDVEWKPTPLAGALCRGFRTQETLSGDVEPFVHDLTTTILWGIHDSTLVGRPRVRPDTIRVVAHPSPESWEKVRARLLEQDRIGRCGLVMNADSVLARLQQLAGRGFGFHLPETLFPPFRFPLAIEGSYVAGGYRIAARAFDPDISVGRDYVRFAFRTSLMLGTPPPDTATARAPVPIPPPRATNGLPQPAR